MGMWLVSQVFGHKPNFDCYLICTQTYFKSFTSLFLPLGSMHQLHKSERRVSGSQGPPSHPDPHPLPPTTGLRPLCDPHRLLVSRPQQPPCQITPVRPGTTRAAASPHAPGAALSTAIASAARPSTLNHTDKPHPTPNPPTHPL